MTAMTRFPSIILIALFVAGATATAASDTSRGADDAIKATWLRDRVGRPRSLDDLRGESALAIVFLNDRMAKDSAALAALTSLEPKLRTRSIACVAIYEGCGISAATAHALSARLTWTVVVDSGARVAKAMNVDTTPWLRVLDPTGAVRMSQSIAALSTGAAPELETAILSASAGQDMAPRANLEGMGTPLPTLDAQATDSRLTYANDIAPLIRKRCERCHRESGMAPFSLTTFEQVRSQGEMVAEVTQDEFMPPWHVDPQQRWFADERIMPAEERRMIGEWVKAGMPAGDLSTVQSTPPGPRWRMGQPDIVLEADTPQKVPADGVVPYRHWIMPESLTGAVFASERWVQGAEMLSSARGVTHHLTVYVFAKGVEPDPGRVDDAIGMFGWIPGAPAFLFPEGSALRIPAGSRLLLEMHYTPIGKEVEDRPAVAFRFAKEPPAREIRIETLLSFHINVPPGHPHWPGIHAGIVRREADLIGVIAHMHARGKSFTLDLFPPGGGERRPLIHIPRFDANWQTSYAFATPIPLRPGAKLLSECSWDNSAMNVQNPDPKRSAEYGMQFDEEMHMTWMILSIPRAPGMENVRVVEQTPAYFSRPIEGTPWRTSLVAGFWPSVSLIKGSSPTVRLASTPVKSKQLDIYFLVGPRRTNAAGKRFRVSFRGRADRERTLLVSPRISDFAQEVKLITPPPRPVTLSPQWKDFAIDFLVPSTEQDIEPAIVSYGLGGQAGAPFEISGFSLEAIGDEAKAATFRPGLGAARIEPLAGRPRGVRVAAPATSALEAVTVIGSAVEIAPGKDYVLRATARSDRPRPFALTVQGAAAPASRGRPWLEGKTGPEWRSFRAFFFATERRQGDLTLLVGGDATPLEIDAVSARETFWSLAGRHADRAEFETSGEDESRVRVTPGDIGDGTPWRLTLRAPRFPVRRGDRATLEFQARADADRPAGIRLLADDAPYEAIGLSQEITMGSEWKTYSTPFEATHSRPARFVINLGASATPVEVRGFKVSAPATPGQ